MARTPRIIKRGNKWGYYQRWVNKEGTKCKRWYNVKYAGKFREDLPALIKKGYSGRKALSYLRNTKRYHLRTQSFYDIYREQKKQYAKEPVIKKLPEDVTLTDTHTTLTTLHLTTKYMLLFEFDVRDTAGKLIDTGHYGLPLNQLPTRAEAITMVNARMTAKLEQSPKKAKIKRFYSNYRLTGVWKRREKAIVRVKRGQRYA